MNKDSVNIEKYWETYDVLSVDIDTGVKLLYGLITNDLKVKKSKVNPEYLDYCDTLSWCTKNKGIVKHKEYQFSVEEKEDKVLVSIDIAFIDYEQIEKERNALIQ